MNIDVWIPVAASVGLALVINLVLFAYFMGSMKTELRQLKEKIDAIGDSHTSIELLKARVKNTEESIRWGTSQFEAIWRAVRALNRGEKVRDYDPIDPDYPNRPPA